MQILIGGSGSTGSSLLKNILNRHSAIFAGGETSFFSKKEIYDDWSSAKNKVLNRGLFGLRNHGWHLYNGTDMLEDEYLLNKEELKQLLSGSESLSEFSESFYEKAMKAASAEIWLEKTPANASCFTEFLETFGEARIIHMVRNPYDCIASLYKRGFNIYYATGIYLLNCSSALKARSSYRYREISYEDLILRPEEVLKRLSKHLSLTFSEVVLESKGEKIDRSKLDGWQYDETEGIGKGSVGRFAKLQSVEQELIKNAIANIRVSKAGIKYYNVPVRSIEEICKVLSYEYLPPKNTALTEELRKLMRKDRWSRIKRGYPTGLNYPLELVTG